MADLKSLNLEAIVFINVAAEAKGMRARPSVGDAVKSLRAPVAHRFAAGVPGVSAQDVERAVRRVGTNKDTVLNVAYMGCTPLDLATACDNPDAIEELLRMGADPNSKEGLKMTRNGRKNFEAHPVHTAINFRRPRCLEVLMRTNSSVAETYPGKSNEIVHHALCQLCDTGVGAQKSEEVLKVLLEFREGLDAMDVISTGSVTVTPLTFCVMMSSVGNERASEPNKEWLNALEILLKAGAQVSKTSLHHTPLTMACESKCSPKIVSMLLRHGADPNAHEALSGTTCLNYAIKTGQLEKIRMLLHKGADLNVMGPNGNRPFFTTCRVEYKNGSTVLLNHTKFRVDKDDFLNLVLEWRKVLRPTPEEKFYMYREEERLPRDIRPKANPKEINLHRLVSHGDIDGMRSTLPKCSPQYLNTKKQSGLPVLHAATIKNDIEIVELLLKHGADVNGEDDDGDTPMIHAAMRSNSLEVLDMLSSEGADINLMNKYSGKTPLFVAAQSNKVENVEHLCVTLKADPNTVELTIGTTPLHLMAQLDNALVIDVILKSSKANVNVLNCFGATPLHYAAKTDAKDAANCLINKEAAVDIACAMMKNTPIHVAAACNSPQVAKLLIKKGANINARNKSQETPLFLAAATGSRSMIQLLLNKGVEIDARNKYGQTPLYIAVSYEEFEVARILVENGADIEARDNHRKETILHIATSVGNIDFVEYLLRRGADKEAKDVNGLTPLLRSATTEIGRLTFTLLEHGCDATVTLDSQNRRDHDLTVLHLLEHNHNVIPLDDIVTICPRTRKPKLHPALKSCPMDIKRRTIEMWKIACGNYLEYRGKWV